LAFFKLKKHLHPPFFSTYSDADTYKDYSLPPFDELVNFPEHLPKNQSSSRSNLDSEKMVDEERQLVRATTTQDGKRQCVMCAKKRVCTGIPSSAADVVASTKQKENGKGQGEGDVDVDGVCDGVIIPRQNKGLCTKCDVTVWVVRDSSVQIKWCKGCKNFRPWARFGDKGGATKCVRCRDRQKEKYAAQKNQSQSNKPNSKQSRKRKSDNSIDRDSVTSGDDDITSTAGSDALDRASPGVDVSFKSPTSVKIE
jgi:hypothetical protein